jgi:hypothetical protein
MARIDGKRSARFNVDEESNAILKAMEGYQYAQGDWLAYYRWDPAATIMDDVYDEAVGQGLIYKPPFQLPVLHVTHIEGANEYGDAGFYYNDDLDAQIAFDKFVQAGMSMADITTGAYIKDRVLYDRKIFRVTQLAIEGQVQQRDLVVGLSATMCKPDELVNDVVFALWSQGGQNDQEGTQ